MNAIGRAVLALIRTAAWGALGAFCGLLVGVLNAYFNFPRLDPVVGPDGQPDSLANEWAFPFLLFILLLHFVVGLLFGAFVAQVGWKHRDRVIVSASALLYAVGATVLAGLLFSALMAWVPERSAFGESPARLYMTMPVIFFAAMIGAAVGLGAVDPRSPGDPGSKKEVDEDFAA